MLPLFPRVYFPQPSHLLLTRFSLPPPFPSLLLLTRPTVTLSFRETFSVHLHHALISAFLGFAYVQVRTSPSHLKKPLPSHQRHTCCSPTAPPQLGARDGRRSQKVKSRRRGKPRKSRALRRPLISGNSSNVALSFSGAPYIFSSLLLTYVQRKRRPSEPESEEQAAREAKEKPRSPAAANLREIHLIKHFEVKHKYLSQYSLKVKQDIWMVLITEKLNVVRKTFGGQGLREDGRGQLTIAKLARSRQATSTTLTFLDSAANELGCRVPS
ncbi:hypothetical protein KSP40_PGU016704 [Platanthera guangdongensis]|uniref:MADF domain-containing protein n=1 Tax=Platanthera guangdongensis TaxID=2320717 RepID=A0ABR2LGI5_9ASPA